MVSALDLRLRHVALVIDLKQLSIDSLLAPTSSDGRKLWGFELFRLSLARVPPSDLSRMFTPNFMRSWVNHLSKRDRCLHMAAKLVVCDRNFHDLASMSTYQFH
jgi:DNA polymerase phi